MTKIITGDIWCPLCEKPMRSNRIQHQGKIFNLFVCRPCKIGCFDFDPAFNKWRDADKVIPCGTCGNPVKWFIRYLDGYFKSFCPYCKTTMEKDGDVNISKGGALILPEDMDDDPVEEPVQVMIPFDKLKRLGKDKLNALKNKMRRKQQHDKTN